MSETVDKGSFQRLTTADWFLKVDIILLGWYEKYKLWSFYWLLHVSSMINVPVWAVLLNFCSQIFFKCMEIQHCQYTHPANDNLQMAH